MGKAINPQSALLILGEMQMARRVLTALNYFNEEVPECAIAIAGTLLSIATHGGVLLPA